MRVLRSSSETGMDARAQQGGIVHSLSVAPALAADLQTFSQAVKNTAGELSHQSFCLTKMDSLHRHQQACSPGLKR